MTIFLSPEEFTREKVLADLDEHSEDRERSMNQVMFVATTAHDGEGVRSTGVILVGYTLVEESVFDIREYIMERFPEALKNGWPDSYADYPVTMIMSGWYMASDDLSEAINNSGVFNSEPEMLKFAS